MKIFPLALCLILMSVGCSRQPADSCVDGVWKLTREVYHSGSLYEPSPTQGGTYLRFYVGDSIYYMCEWAMSAEGHIIRPYYKAPVDVKKIDDGTMLYFEDNQCQPMRMVNDSTMIITARGCDDTWVRVCDIPRQQLGEMQLLLQQLDWNNRDAARNYAFTHVEQQLKAQVLWLTLALITFFILIVISVRWAYLNYRNRQRIELQLKRLEHEQAHQLPAVTETLCNLQQQFHESDYYVSLMHRIKQGERLTTNEWNELDSQVNQVYVGFTNKLVGLHHMSDVEYRICLLIKLGVTPTDMATQFCKATSTISATRMRLYQKVFHRKGSAHDWDEFILTL